MTTVIALVTGIVFATGFYSMLRRQLFSVVVGLILMSQACNLLVFTSGGIARAEPPIVPMPIRPLEPITDPLPQALILTAIVINFGTIAFALGLAYRVYKRLGTHDTDALRETES